MEFFKNLWNKIKGIFMNTTPQPPAPSFNPPKIILQDPVKSVEPVSLAAPWLDWMLKHQGEKTQTGAKPTPFIEEIFSHTTYGPLKGVTPSSCAAGICTALEENDFKSTKSAAAHSYVDYGTKCEVRTGAILVFEFDPGHFHVTLALKVEGKKVVCVGANQSHFIQQSTYELKYLVASRWPVKK